MRRIHIKRSRRGLVGVSVLVLVICGVVSHNTKAMEKKIQKQQEEVTSLEKNKKSLLEKQQTLKDSLTLSQEDIEKIAHEKLHLVYPNEKIVQSQK